LTTSRVTVRLKSKCHGKDRRESKMAKFLIEETLTSENYANMLRNPEDRSEVLKSLFKSAGCKLESGYASGIENKAYLIVEAPDLNTVYTVGANFVASGAASAIKYTPLITLPEIVDICKKAAVMGYRPPGK
jgi:uncharacterized protein with GYD domain